MGNVDKWKRCGNSCFVFLSMSKFSPMSKHSKWAKIKRQKGVADVKRGVVFSKLSRAITIAAKDGGIDPDSNFRLRIAIDRALTENMPKDNIQRAIERAGGAGGEASLESITVEGRSQSGAVLLVDAVTDNRNRTIGDIKKILADRGGHMTDAGSAQWMFERKGQIIVENVGDLEQAELDAIDAGATDIDQDEKTLQILTSPETVHSVAKQLKDKKYEVSGIEIIMNPKNPVNLGEEEYNRLQELVEILEEHEDVSNVTTNAAQE